MSCGGPGTLTQVLIPLGSLTIIVLSSLITLWACKRFMPMTSDADPHACTDHRE